MVSSFLVSPSFFWQRTAHQQRPDYLLVPLRHLSTQQHISLCFDLHDVSLGLRALQCRLPTPPLSRCHCKILHQKKDAQVFNTATPCARLSIFFRSIRSNHSLLLILYTYILFQLPDSSGHCVRGAERSQIFRVQV